MTNQQPDPQPDHRATFRMVVTIKTSGEGQGAATTVVRPVTS